MHFLRPSVSPAYTQSWGYVGKYNTDLAFDFLEIQHFIFQQRLSSSVT